MLYFEQLDIYTVRIDYQYDKLYTSDGPPEGEYRLFHEVAYGCNNI